jgi:bifunctional UDP-N-acetylglucosamine pyrophosphorylase/glucosamine-1-phosphate N-acetyltransferase
MPTTETAADDLLIVVLAAGKGTRMKSARPKVMHRVAGLSMLGHALKTATGVGAARIAVVVGPDMADVRAEALGHVAAAEIYEQPGQRGTADAVLAAAPALARHTGDVMVVFADNPLITPASLTRLRTCLGMGAAVAVLGFKAQDPTGYGRLLIDAVGDVVAIREHNDASEAERALGLCNSGVMAFRTPRLLDLLKSIGTNNAKGEFYLTDVVGLARASGLRVAYALCDEREVLGVNSRAQLAEAESAFQARRRAAVMAEGATLIAPETVFLSHDTIIGRDVVIEPNVFFGPRVVVEDDCVIHANCHLEGTRLRAGTEIGPFARLRPGADIGPEGKIGNFVEVKNVRMANGAKANHLAYLGDGTVGEGANIGAGTIFCNYDGFNKHRTEVGAGAFVGSNSALVAPVKIGAGAFIGSGSVITKDVEADALALERSPQEVRPGWAAKFRALMERQKTKPKSA